MVSHCDCATLIKRLNSHGHTLSIWFFNRRGDNVVLDGYFQA